MVGIIWYYRTINSASLSVALVISEGGYIEETATGIDLNFTDLILSTYGWSVVFLAIISVLYISSGFLTYYASKAEDKRASDLTRTWFLIWTLPTLVITQFTFLGLRSHNYEHFVSAQNYWYLFGLSSAGHACCSILNMETPQLRYSFYYDYAAVRFCILRLRVSVNYRTFLPVY